MNHRAQSYEESLDRETRRAEGIYYTPADIVVDMLSTLRVDGDETLCDPCCGGGNFLMGALEMGVRVENLYGFDSDPRAVDIARERVREATGFDATENIRVADFWDVAPTLGRRFDIIASNPPWGSHLDSLRRCDLSTLYGAGRSSDSSSLMLLAALSTLRKGGELTFLLPDAFFNIGSFEEVRRKVLALEITHLRDYGKPFRGLMTRAQSITLRNRKSKSDHQAECRYEGQQHLRSLRSFRLNPKSIINMWLSSQGAEVVEAIYAKPHITLANNATWGMGIVTGNNSLYCHREPEEGDVEVVRGYNITLDGITTPDTYISRDMSNYQQVAHEEFYVAPEKIIYRFIANRPIFCNDREQHYILNSANGFIPNRGFEMSCDQIVERLNSDVMAWLFASLFRTHKILRYDIERLPLHTQVGVFSEEAYQEYLGLEKSKTGYFILRGVRKTP